MNPQKQRRSLNLVLALLILAVPVIGWLKIDTISDWWKLRSYSPPAQIAQLAQQTTMTEQARKYFYVNHPELIRDKQTFSTLCHSEQTIILGCYHSGENGIALFDIQDSRLEGIEQVTAAHETLHAAYDRLSSKQKQKINTQLENFYQTGLSDQRIKDTIDLYKKTEPDSIVDEMHSIFGTEVSALPKELENYYSGYFSDRQQIVSYSNNYEAVFVQAKDQLNSWSKEIESLKASLDSQRQQIESEQAALTAENRRMQAFLEDNQTSQYNSAVPGYNGRVQRLRSSINDYNAKIARVNSLVEQYNSLAYTQQNLYKAIDSRVQSQSTQ